MCTHVPDAGSSSRSVCLPPMSASKRVCGTPGCDLPDFHEGLCSTSAVSVKRPRTLIHPPPPPRARTFRASSRPAPAPQATEPPAQQRILPNGLHRFYHGQRWGVPLPDGRVEHDANSDDEVDDGWRLRQLEQRIATRAGVTELQTTFMNLWNAHVHGSPPVVSDRKLPESCRRFATSNARVLSGKLRQVGRS